MKIAISVASIFLLSTNGNGFIVHKNQPHRLARQQMSSTEESEVDVGYTPELKKVTDAFARITDEQLRYKQLLYMAQNTKEVNNMPESLKVPENKVPGCLSTVYVDGTARLDEETGDYLIDFIGDSDGLLTRGLVALLIRCLSGNTAEAIQKVDPEFIKVTKIEQSLTPGRNNGFLNMLRVMKQKAATLDAAAQNGNDPTSATDDGDDDSETTVAASSTDEMVGADPSLGPKGTAMVTALQVLKPTMLKLVDNSHEHAGHAGNDARDGESHFQLQIVAEAFDGLNLVKRHQLIYMMLGDIMPQIHALQIQSFTPEELAARSQ